MKPFVERISGFTSKGGKFSPGPLEFLNDWQSPINEDNLENLTDLGAKDSREMGEKMRNLYPQLFPPLGLGKPKSNFLKENQILSKNDDKGLESEKKKGDKVKTSFKVWTASSSRDINTAKSFVKGAFPKHHRGQDGEGDGKYVELVEVDNKDESWSSSLTPHVSVKR